MLGELGREAARGVAGGAGFAAGHQIMNNYFTNKRDFRRWWEQATPQQREAYHAYMRAKQAERRELAATIGRWIACILAFTVALIGTTVILATAVPEVRDLVVTNGWMLVYGMLMTGVIIGLAVPGFFLVRGMIRLLRK